MNNITVLVRRWFDGLSTYQSMRVLVDNNEVDVIPFRYGYDAGDTMFRKLLTERWYKYGLPEPEKDMALWEYKERHNITVTWDLVEVNRKKHLHNGGK